MALIELSFAAVFYTGSAIVVIAALWYLADRRDRALYDRTRRRTTYHCLKCDRPYTQPGGGDTARCPRCDRENPRLHF